MSQAVVAPPFIPSRDRQMDLCEFKASLVYISSSRTVKATHRNPVLETNKQTKTKKYVGVGEIVKLRRALPALAEDLGSVPSTHTAHNCLSV